MKRMSGWGVVVLLAVALGAGAASVRAILRLGRQPDGSFLVSTGQRVPAAAIAFTGRPIELAVHPEGDLYAIASKNAVFLAGPQGVIEGSAVPFPKKVGPGFRGLAWTPDGQTLIASTSAGYLQVYRHADRKLTAGDRVELPAPAAGERKNPVPGGIAMLRDGSRFYVTACNRNAVYECDTATGRVLRKFPVQNLPFEVRLDPAERTLIVSNWGGRPPRDAEPRALSDGTPILVDAKGAPASGTVSLIERDSGATRHLDVGLHPCALAVDARQAYVANAMSDTISEIDLDAGRVSRTIPIQWGQRIVLGSMPNALALAGETLLVCNGGDNALCEIDRRAGRVQGFRPAGFFPVAIALARDQKTALVLNTKGHGSVARTVIGKPGNAHDFQGTLAILPRVQPLAEETAQVAANNRWDRPAGSSALKVYHGAIKHVLYIIKENRTYDEVFGDLPQGQGDPSLCSLGETVMPNHRKIAREFTLFDNGYCSGTNSADGHAWSTQCIANDYLEHFYVGYSRSYPDDGEDPMAFAHTGALWDAAARKGLSIRVFGEFCDDAAAKIEPRPKDWFEVWEDYKAGGRKFRFQSTTRVAGLKPFINPDVLYWPLLQCDQQRADIFIREFQERSRANQVPHLMILSLPCDHGEGVDPRYPTPRAMMADNDLALGRVVEAVSHSPQWKNTCIFVVEDDAQSGPDHIDGHRTVFMAISPYNRRRTVDSTLYTQTNMIRSIGMMLGLPPLNKFDAFAEPMEACFHDTLDTTPYKHVPNRVPLDERNPSGSGMTPADRYWLEKSLALDWSGLDRPDPYWLNRIHWHSLFQGRRPYPARPGEEPRQEPRDLDDD